MHEFSVIQSIIDIATDSARLNHAVTISAVEVEVGQASGIVTEALEFAWESARKGTLLENADLVINSVPVRVLCRSCNHKYQPVDIFEACPSCGDINPEIISGRELRVTAIVT
jgi:hydrogenase nickel incorporation protein HypA/HybF